MFAHAPGFMALVSGTDLRFLVANEAFQKLVGRSDLMGRAFNEAFPELDDQGIDDILLGVARSGEAFVARAMPMTVVRSDLRPEELVLDLVFQPIPEGTSFRATTLPTRSVARCFGSHTPRCSRWRSPTARSSRRSAN